MAIVRYGTTVIGIRGTIAGITFTAGHSGPYCKAWKRPKDQRTAIAATSKQSITPYGAIWSSMSDALQIDWNYFAANPPELDFNSLGIQYWLTGFQWLVRVNVRRAMLGLGPTTTVPTATSVSAPATATLQATAGNPIVCEISWTAGTFPEGTGALLYIAVHPTTGLQSFPGKGILAWTDYEPAGTNFDFSAQQLDRFGNTPLGWMIFGNLHVLRDDGVRSLATPAKVAVT